MDNSKKSFQSRSNTKNIIGMSEEELKLYCREHGYREFHGSQIFRWIYFHLPDDFDKMSDLPESLRIQLKQDFVLHYYRSHRELISAKKDAKKYSFIVDGKNTLEAVALVDTSGRTSFCISSQIGCPVGCLFCATGKVGFFRNLTSEEIINEVLSLQKLHKRPDSILFMGMGEPLLNYNPVVKTIERLHDLGFGHRKITVSTCGIVEGIKKLAVSGLRPRLALSIGSALEEKRRKIVPIACKNSLLHLKKAIISYREKTGRRVSLEYTLIKGLNDTNEDAIALSDFTKSTKTHVNIIRYNPVEKIELSTPETQTVQMFKNILLSKGVEVSERYRRGRDIEAACGQLTPGFYKSFA